MKNNNNNNNDNKNNNYNKDDKNNNMQSGKRKASGHIETVLETCHAKQTTNNKNNNLQAKGRRADTYRQYLRPAMQNNTNLVVVTQVSFLFNPSLFGIY